MIIPALYSRWVHNNGLGYTVVLIANEYSRSDNHPIHVIYAGDNGRIWCKNITDFNQKMTLT